MEIHAEETYFQEGDHVRIKRIRETGRVSATDGGLLDVLMDQTHEIRLLAKKTPSLSSSLQKLMRPGEKEGRYRAVASCFACLCL